MSGWYGVLPAGWRERRVKHIFREVTDLSTDGDETLLSVSEYFGVKPRSEVIEEGDFLSRAESFVGYKRLKANDPAMNIMLAWKTGLGFSAFDGIISPAYSVFRLTEPRYNPWYFNHLLRSRQAVDEFRRWSYGIMDSRLRLYPSVFMSLPLPVPPVHVQNAIAAYLDEETARITALIDRKQRFIDLLLEKRTALITHAVTKGLDPDAEMKDSGVLWIGDIPAHWSVMRLRHLCDVSTGGRDTVDADPSAPYPFFVRSQTVERIDTYSFDGEAVLTAGDGAGVAKVFHYFVGKFDYHQRVYAFTRFRHVSGHFFFHFIRENFYKVALDGAAKSTVDSLRRPMILDFWMTVPPVSEQAAIVEHVHRESAQMDALIDKTRRSIDLLREYRTALISAAVTGQIEIPGVEASEEVA